MDPILSGFSLCLSASKIVWHIGGLSPTILGFFLPCFEGLSVDSENQLEWIVMVPFEKCHISRKSHLTEEIDLNGVILEFGPRFVLIVSYQRPNQYQLVVVIKLVLAICLAMRR